MKNFSTISLIATIVSAIILTGCVSQSPASKSDPTPSPAPAAQQIYTLKVAHTMTPTGTPVPNKQYEALKFKEIIEARSQGRIKVEIYPAGQLYKDPDALTAVAGGTIFGTMVGQQVVSTIEPKFDIFNTWGLFQSVEQAHKFFATDGWEQIKKSFDAKGLIVAVHPNQTMNLFTPTPVTKLSDVLGYKMRSAESPVEIECAKAAFPGIDMVVVNSADLFTAFQTGLVKAQVSLPLSVQSRKLHTFTPYMLDDPAFYLSTLVFVASKTQINNLPTDLRATVIDAVMEADKLTEKHDLEVYGPSAISSMVKEGLKFTKLEPGEWDKARANMKPVFDKYRKSIGEDIWIAAEKAR